MLSIINYKYSKRLPPNSSLSINYAGCSLIADCPLNGVTNPLIFGDLLSIYEIVLFYLDRYFNSKILSGRVIDITNIDLSELATLEKYIKDRCNSGRTFLLYRPYNTDYDVVMQSYDIVKIDFNITLANNFSLDISPFEFKSTRSGYSAYRIIRHILKPYNPVDWGILRTVLLVRSRAGNHTYTSVSFDIIDPYIRDKADNSFFKFIKMENIPLVCTDIQPIVYSPSPVITRIPAVSKLSQLVAY